MKIPPQLLAGARTEDLIRLARYIGVSTERAPKNAAAKRRWLIDKIAAVTNRVPWFAWDD